MLYTDQALGVRRADGVLIIDAIETGARAAHLAPDANAGDGWAAVTEWARSVVARISAEQPTRHISVFVPDDDGAGLRLAAQAWGAGEDTGEVIPGGWRVPLDGSVCGRVYRTGQAALRADVAMDPDYLPFPGSQTRSALTIPVGPPESVVAVVSVEAPWVSAFSIRDFDRITDHAASALATFPGRSEG
jgi:hypothetical protein